MPLLTQLTTVTLTPAAMLRLAEVSLVAVFKPKSMVVFLVMLIVPKVTSAPLIRLRLPPLRLSVPANVKVPENTSVPADTVVDPLYIVVALLRSKVRLPVPSLVKEPVPVIEPAKVVLVLLPPTVSEAEPSATLPPKEIGRAHV